MILSFPASRGQNGERRPELGISIPQTGETLVRWFLLRAPLLRRTECSREVSGFPVMCCEPLVGPLPFSCTVWPPLASCPGASLSHSHPHTEICQFQGRSSYPSAGCCRDFCSGVLWFSVSASLSHFAGGGLPCDLLSLMGLSGVADFQSVQLFTC